MLSIKYKCRYLDASRVRVHSCEFIVQQMRRLLKKTNPPPLVEEETPFENTYIILERTRISSGVPTGSE